MTDFSLWDEATRDYEAEVAERRFAHVKVAASAAWPYLSGARNASEFENRLALSEDSLRNAVASVAGTDLALAATLGDQLQASLREDYAIVAEARQEAALKEALAGAKKVSVHLNNVGVEGPGVGKGTAPDGTQVRFLLSPQDEKDLKAVLFSDLAVNFSGVDVDADDIITQQGGGNDMSSPARAGSKTSTRRVGVGSSGQHPNGSEEDYQEYCSNMGLDPASPASRLSYDSELEDRRFDEDEAFLDDAQRGLMDAYMERTKPNLFQRIFSTKQAGTSTYCPNHGVYVGEGNQENHDHCTTEQRETKDSGLKTAYEKGDKVTVDGRPATYMHDDSTMASGSGRIQVEWETPQQGDSSSGYEWVNADKVTKAGSKTADKSTDQSPGRWKAQMAGVGEDTWSGNGVTFSTQDEAKDYASDLLSRWYGADMARVVPVETPLREAVDPSDPQIVINYRTSARTASTGVCGVCGAPIREEGGRWLHNPTEWDDPSQGRQTLWNHEAVPESSKTSASLQPLTWDHVTAGVAPSPPARPQAANWESVTSAPKGRGRLAALWSLGYLVTCPGCGQVRDKQMVTDEDGLRHPVPSFSDNCPNCNWPDAPEAKHKGDGHGTWGRTPQHKAPQVDFLHTLMPGGAMGAAGGDLVKGDMDLNFSLGFDDAKAGLPDRFKDNIDYTQGYDIGFQDKVMDTLLQGREDAEPEHKNLFQRIFSSHRPFLVAQGALTDLDEAALDAELRRVMVQQNDTRDAQAQSVLAEWRKMVENEIASRRHTASKTATNADILIAYDDPKSRCRNCGKAAHFADKGKGQAIHDSTGEAQCHYDGGGTTAAAKSDVCPRCGEHMDDVHVNGDTMRAVCHECGWQGSKTKTGAYVEGPVSDLAALIATASEADLDYLNSHLAGEQVCEYCGEKGHDYTKHPEAVRDVGDWEREKQREEFPFGDHRESSLIFTACRKCASTGHDASGGACDYCDGAGVLDPTTAMLKDADGWTQGITREAFARTSKWIDEVRRVHEQQGHETVDGVLIDMQSANAMTMVYDALSPENQAKADAMDVATFGQWAWSKVKVSTRQAVNTDAQGAERYQHTPSPAVPEWLNDAWGKPSGPGLDDGRANAKGRLPKVDERQTTKQASSDDACTKCNGTGSTDNGMGSVSCSRCGGDGIDPLKKQSADNMFMPENNPMVTHEPTFSGQPGTRQSPHDTGAPSTGQRPLTTKPRTVPGADGGDPIAENAPPDNITAGRQAERNALRPPLTADQKAKIDSIQASVLATNPGIDKQQARRIAVRTVRQYQGVSA